MRSLTVKTFVYYDKQLFFSFNVVDPGSHKPDPNTTLKKNMNPVTTKTKIRGFLLYRNLYTKQNSLMAIDFRGILNPGVQNKTGSGSDLFGKSRSGSMFSKFLDSSGSGNLF